MKEAVLVLIKPDGISKGLMGSVMGKFAPASLEIVALGIRKATRELAENHYRHLRNEPFFEGVIDYLMGKYHKRKKLIAIVYYGEGAIKKCRKIAGATSPEEADPFSIRGSYGRITTKGLYENVVHVSSGRKDAEREIKIWFSPDDVTKKLYPIKIKVIRAHKESVWK